jgi:endoribonuclease LACTB2
VTIEFERTEPDVIRLRMSSWRGRSAGYDVSAYLLRGVLVDTGFPRVGRELIAALADLRPRGAVVTHWHEDHSGNAPLLAAEGIPLRLHPFTESVLRARPRIGLYRRVVWGRPLPLEGVVHDFDVSPLRVITTPGHTPDHVVIWDEERGIAASGDLFLGVKVRIAHVHESPRALVRSLRAVVALAPRVLLDAHRGPIVDPVPILQAKIDWMEETIGQVEMYAARGWSERAIRSAVLGAEEFTGYVSFGEYSRQALVHAVLNEKEDQAT